ncbi:hypothetical protein SERLA73DRAFT_190331 [Serpula lacrymans var. lacrymans S7.3]|uniref:Uncharacterized protein n=1 Tax=Serpula lacrymans var. lacrymans (strain S7.3) TaxID=936435 RepID=F8QFH4_SERL3|nr:hypothetical protein SERLA73DRAFT_190331 [Serpula lacrymans var. lacrymans S7.3]
MARHVSSTDASDSDDAPESFSLSQSKKNVKEKSQVLKNFEASEKAKKKIQNRERDRKLKERALVTRHLGQPPAKTTEDSDGSEGESGAEDEAVARMRRAMREAGEEMDDDDESDSEGDEDSDDNKEGDDNVWSGFDGGDHEVEEGSDEDAEDDGDEDESMSDGDQSDEMEEEEDAMMLAIPTKSAQNTKSNSKYLQDDLFTSAFSAQSKSRKINPKATPKVTSTSQKQDVLKRRRRKPQPSVKDLIVGSRTVRTLPKASDSRAMATAKTLPPHTVKKFVSRSLNLKGEERFAKSRGWERRPANIGVLKSDGAPVGFVRRLV